MPTVAGGTVVAVGMEGVDTPAEAVRTSAEAALGWVALGALGWVVAMAVFEAEVWLRLGVSAG